MAQAGTQPRTSPFTPSYGGIRPARFGATLTFVNPIKYVPISPNSLVSYQPLGGALAWFHIDWDHSLRLMPGWLPPVLEGSYTLLAPVFRDGWGVIAYDPHDNNVRLALAPQTTQEFQIGDGASSGIVFTQAADYWFGAKPSSDPSAYDRFFGKNTFLFYDDQTPYAEIHTVDPYTGSHTGTVVRGIPPACRVLWVNLSAHEWPSLLVSDGQTVALYMLHDDSGALRADRWIAADAELGAQLFSLSRIPLSGGDMLPVVDDHDRLVCEQHLLSYDPDSGLAKIALVRMYDAEIRVKVLECLSNYWPSQLKVSVYPSVSKDHPSRIVRYSGSPAFFDILDYRPAKQFWQDEDLVRIGLESI